MSTLLSIDTVASPNRIFLTYNKKVIASSRWIPHQNEAEKLLPGIVALCKKADKKITDLTKIIVINGPGKFTSTRVGIMVANTMAMLLHIPIVGIDRFDFILSRLNEKQRKTALQIFLESERGDFYTKKYDTHNKGGIPEIVTEVPDCGDTKKLVVFQDGRIEGDYTTKELLSYETGILKINDSIAGSMDLIDPLYVREANITKRKKL